MFDAGVMIIAFLPIHFLKLRTIFLEWIVKGRGVPAARGVIFPMAPVELGCFRCYFDVSIQSYCPLSKFVELRSVGNSLSSRFQLAFT